ncbi:hypothetical protein ACB092_12G168100 [Castanea dentata]
MFPIYISFNFSCFFSIANHTLIVVETDAVYLKPFETDTLLIAPGQTLNVLLKTKPNFPNASFFMAASPYFTGSGTFDNSIVAGILEYKHPSHYSASKNLTLSNQPSLFVYVVLFVVYVSYALCALCMR